MEHGVRYTLGALAVLLLQVLIVCLVFVVAEPLTGDHVWAFVAVAPFALHPVHTESVAWIAGVTDLERTFFCLITFLSPSTTRRF